MFYCFDNLSVRMTTKIKIENLEEEHLLTY
jgi:hypothetical protein